MKLSLPPRLDRFLSPRAHPRSRRSRAAVALGTVAVVLCAALAGCSVGGDPVAVESVAGHAISMSTYQQFVAILKDEDTQQGASVDWQTPQGRGLLAQVQTGALGYLANAILIHQQVTAQHIGVTSKTVQAQLTSLGSSIKAAAQQNPSDAVFRSLAQAVKPATDEVTQHADLYALMSGRASSADVLVILSTESAEQQALTAHASVPTATVKLIEVNTKQEAEALKTQVEHGADFTALAKAHSLDTGSGQQGGDLGRPFFYVGELSQLSAPLDQTIFTPPYSAAKTAYVVAPMDSTGTSKYLLAQVTNRSSKPLSGITDSTTQGGVFNAWIALVLTPGASIQRFVALDPTPTPAPAAPQG